MSWLLDASAVLALLRDEPGAAQVERLVSDDGAMITTVNAIEVMRRLRRDGHPPDLCEQALDALPIFHVPFSREMGLRAARIEDAAGTPPLALGDRACIGAALELACPIATADGAWHELELPVEVLLVR